jgi:glycerol uptake facilitator-like aquaporin
LLLKKRVPAARLLLTEAIGTFALVFAGCGAIMVDAKTHQLGHVGVAITFGLVIMFGIYAVGHISGAHFNPAVTFGFALTRHFPWTRAVAYWAAQILGAVAAAAILRGSLGNVAHLGATLPSGSQGQSFLWELILTFFLMFVIMSVATIRAQSVRQPRSRSVATSGSTRCSAARSRAPR